MDPSDAAAQYGFLGGSGATSEAGSAGESTNLLVFGQRWRDRSDFPIGSLVVDVAWGCLGVVVASADELPCCCCVAVRKLCSEIGRCGGTHEIDAQDLRIVWEAA